MSVFSSPRSRSWRCISKKPVNYSVVNLLPVSVYAGVALCLLAFGRRHGGLYAVLVASYCGVILVSFTRGTMGSVLLVQMLLILLAPRCLGRRALPAAASRLPTRLTYLLFAAYLVGIPVAAIRFDPNMAMYMAGRFQSTGAMSLRLAMTGYRLFVWTTLVLAFALPLGYEIDRPTLRGCLKAAWLLSTVVALAGIVDYLGLADMKFDLTVSLQEALARHEVIMGFRRGALGMMSLLGIFLSFAYLLLSRGSWTRVLVGLSFPILIGGLVCSWSRAAMLGVAVAALLLPLTMGAARLRVILPGLVCLLALVVGVAVSPNLRERLAFFGTGAVDGSIEGRLGCWRALLNYLAASPGVLLTGVGTQNFQYALRESAEVVNLSAAHNQYLHLLAEIGLGGVTVFLLWLAVLLRFLLRWQRQARDRVEKVLPGILIAVLAGILVSGFTQESLAPSASMVPWLLHFYLILGIFVSWYRYERAHPVDPTVAYWMNAARRNGRVHGMHGRPPRIPSLERTASLDPHSRPRT